MSDIEEFETSDVESEGEDVGSSEVVYKESYQDISRTTTGLAAPSRAPRDPVEMAKYRFSEVLATASFVSISGKKKQEIQARFEALPNFILMNPETTILALLFIIEGHELHTDALTDFVGRFKVTKQQSTKTRKKEYPFVATPEDVLRYIRFINK